MHVGSKILLASDKPGFIVLILKTMNANLIKVPSKSI